MNPVSLNLQSFLSYREPTTVDFTGFEVACLVGANGQGKSSLLDAMTWSLFGCARGCEGGMNQERLIHDGAEHMRVEFTFELSGNIYRVVRSRSRSGRADLQFQVRAADGSWRNLAGETLRATEEQIAGVMRMDYRTFVASAFFLQGRADDFLTRMKPDERKDVFVRLLDLGVYEKLEVAAKSEAKNAEALRKAHSQRIDALLVETTQLQSIEVALAGAQATLASSASEVDTADAEHTATQQELARLETSLATVRRERQTLDKLAQRMAEDAHALSAQAAELTRLDELLAKRDMVAAGIAQAQHLSGVEAEMAAAAAKRASLETSVERFKGAVEAARRELAGQAQAAKALATQLQQRVDEAAAHDSALGTLAPRLDELATAQMRAEQLGLQLADLRSEHKALGERVKVLESQIAEQEDKLRLLATGDSTCPLCERAFSGSVEGHTLVHDKLAQARAELQVELRSTLDQRAVVAKEGQRIKDDELRARSDATEHRELEQRAAQHRGLAAQAPALAEQLSAAQSAAHTIEASLAAGDYAAPERSQLELLVAQLEATVYDRASHDDVRRQLREANQIVQLAGRIEEAATARLRIEASMATLGQRTADAETELAERTSALAELTEAVADEPAVRQRAALAKRAVEQARSEQATAAATLVRLEERLASVQQAVQQLDDARADERMEADRHRRYQRLAQAFGRGGIPDLIIDNVLPELGQDATEILGELTNYEMHVQFDMKRMTKSGKEKDAFEVLVHYEGGVRPFEMFSGGEAFRIAFAIRLALSKLLTRRAGARLETLVVDEGFGTQDPQGRERLVQVINMARSQFKKVIVITHLDELKEAFGTQLRVQRDARSGSRVDVVGSV